MKLRNSLLALALAPLLSTLGLVSAQNGKSILNFSRDGAQPPDIPAPPPPDALPFEIVLIIVAAILVVLVVLIVAKVLKPMKKKINFFIPGYLLASLNQEGRLFEMVSILHSIKKGYVKIYTNAKSYYEGIETLKVGGKDEGEAKKLMIRFNIKLDHALALAMAKRTESILLRETKDAWLEKVAKELGVETKIV